MHGCSQFLNQDDVRKEIDIEVRISETDEVISVRDRILYSVRTFIDGYASHSLAEFSEAAFRLIVYLRNFINNYLANDVYLNSGKVLDEANYPALDLDRLWAFTPSMPDDERISLGHAVLEGLRNVPLISNICDLICSAQDQEKDLVVIMGENHLKSPDFIALLEMLREKADIVASVHDGYSAFLDALKCEGASELLIDNIERVRRRDIALKLPLNSVTFYNNDGCSDRAGMQSEGYVTRVD